MHVLQVSGVLKAIKAKKGLIKKSEEKYWFQKVGNTIYYYTKNTILFTPSTAKGQIDCDTILKINDKMGRFNNKEETESKNKQKKSNNLEIEILTVEYKVNVFPSNEDEMGFWLKGLREGRLLSPEQSLSVNKNLNEEDLKKRHTLFFQPKDLERELEQERHKEKLKLSRKVSLNWAKKEKRGSTAFIGKILGSREKDSHPLYQTGSVSVSSPVLIKDQGLAESESVPPPLPPLPPAALLDIYNLQQEGSDTVESTDTDYTETSEADFSEAETDDGGEEFQRFSGSYSPGAIDSVNQSQKDKRKTMHIPLRKLDLGVPPSPSTPLRTVWRHALPPLSHRFLIFFLNIPISLQILFYCFSYQIGRLASSPRLGLHQD